jgi:protein transport protein SEC24
MRSTLAAVPATSSLLNKTRLPFALHMQPYCSDNIPVIDNLCITRCASCRTYINPFATFVQNGTRWRCNLCLRINDLPSNFDYDRLTNAAIDRASRADLNEASVEYIAPKEYMVRPPQPCCYVFAVDVSAPAVASGESGGELWSRRTAFFCCWLRWPWGRVGLPSYFFLPCNPLFSGLPGMVDAVCRIIGQNLDNLAGDSRTRVALLAYDSNIHFFNLQPSLTQPSVMVMTDMDDPFLPTSSNDLLVNLEESREVSANKTRAVAREC